MHSCTFDSPALPLLPQERLAFVLVIGSFIFYSGSVALIVTCYHFYAQLATCGLNIFFITFTLVLTIVYTLVSAQTGSWEVLAGWLLPMGACQSPQQCSPWNMPGRHCPVPGMMP